MSKSLSILTTAASDFYIEPGITEKTSSWKIRVIYSILGRMALASLWDRPEDGDVSIIHMKNRIVSLYESYKEVYSDLYFGFESEELAEEIYSLYLSTGVIYHQPNRITISAPSHCECSDVTFTRGYPLGQTQYISGLGTYLLDLVDTTLTPFDMFQIDSVPLKKTWEDIILDRKWEVFSFDSPVEYHRMDLRMKGSFWGDSPDTSGRVSLLRVGLPGSKLYYLYKYESQEIYVSQLDNWRVENSEYRTLSNACLAYYGLLPPIEYSIDGDIVYISFRYLPPKAEYNFIKLYSWPNGTIPSNFKRICSTEVFGAFRTILSEKGFSFKETTT